MTAPAAGAASKPTAGEFTTRASSINRALDQIGDKWCLLIIQEVLWGINSFNEMMEAMGVSRGVLSNRLKWLQEVGCLRKEAGSAGSRRPRYHLTRKSVDLYDSALMAISWERAWYQTPALDAVELVHLNCGQTFTPRMHCRACDGLVLSEEVSFAPGPGATRDVREKKVRRRSSVATADIPSKRALYKNLINVAGDRWTANVVALSYHGLTRFDQFHKELPVATNILSDRLRFLVEEGIFEQVAYRQKPLRYEYHLTAKGRGLFPWFLTMLQWGDRWCDIDNRGQPMLVKHNPCGELLHAEVRCDQCDGQLRAHEVRFTLGGEDAPHPPQL
jgi:DNA-binding HxlR family transcriptional regulator